MKGGGFFVGLVFQLREFFMHKLHQITVQDINISYSFNI